MAAKWSIRAGGNAQDWRKQLRNPTSIEEERLTEEQRGYWEQLRTGFSSIGESMYTVTLPKRMEEAVIQWVIWHREPGHFLSAVLCNNLQDAINRADDENQKCLRGWVQLFYNYAPGRCWGSPALFREWRDEIPNDNDFTRWVNRELQEQEIIRCQMLKERVEAIAPDDIS
jgi:hypothetical protein